MIKSKEKRRKAKMTTEQIKKQVGKNLKEARETKGLTQE